jgi:predicted ATP-grasp superfamily ATP-dependent carboligase
MVLPRSLRSPPIRVLLLDAHTSAGVACIRCLGKAGLSLDVAAPRFLAQGLYSRYALKRHCYPNPEDSVSAFIQWLSTLLHRHTFQAVFPLTESTLLAIHQHRHELPPVASKAIPSEKAIYWTFQKQNTLQLAQNLGIPVPQSQTLKHPQELEPERFIYPVVVKEHSTGIFEGNQIRSGRGIDYPASKEALIQVIQKRYQPGKILLIQEFIQGQGVGLSFLRTPQHGVLFPFAHRRLVEAHLTGSRAVLAEAICLPQSLLQKTIQFVEDAEFYGPVMFEFKENPQRGWTLLEVNGRFWGSLPLALACGIPFPWYWYLALCEPQSLENLRLNPLEKSTKKNIRVHHLLGYLEHVLRTLGPKPPQWPTPFPSFFKSSQGFFEELLSGNLDYSFQKEDPFVGCAEILDRFSLLFFKLFSLLLKKEKNTFEKDAIETKI